MCTQRNSHIPLPVAKSEEYAKAHINRDCGENDE